MTMSVLSPHTLIMQIGPDRFLLYQLLVRKGVTTDSAIYQFLDQVQSQSEDALPAINWKDMSCFSLANCLLDNPAGISMPGREEDLTESDADELLKTLVAYDMLVSDLDYLGKLGKKTSLFDREHIGNFHQQIGNYLFRSRKGDPEEWWIYQKFEKDLSQPRDNPYLWIQHEFMNSFFDQDLSGQTWLDFGCGVGYYSKFFADRHARVLGVDPSESYIELANQHFADEESVSFQKAEFEKPEDFSVLASQQFDGIFMSDVFLYYFEPYKTLDITPGQLLKQLNQLLKPEGVIYIMDPHGCFHLQPWLGEESPFLVSVEYKNRKYRVTPNLEELSRTVEEAGMTISRIRELCCPETVPADSQVKQVTREFPLWWFFELRKS